MAMKKMIISCCLFLLLVQVHGQQQLTNNGNLKLHPGVTIALYGNMANNGTFTDAGQMVNFSGSATQVISGTAPVAFSHLYIHNAAGVSLQQAVTINNDLMLSLGALTLNTYTLTVNNPMASALSRTSGYIVSEQTNNSGKIKWKIDAELGVHIFPLGTTAGTYIPFVLDLTAGHIGQVTVSTYHTAPNNTPYPVTPVAVTTMNNALGIDNSANTVDRFWQIDKDGTSGTATLTFTATVAEAAGIINLKAQRWNAALNAWDAPLPGQTNTLNTVTVPGVSNFSPWTLSGNSSSLPIELLSFTATPVDNSIVDLDWATATETGNDYFTVERSVDGATFETVAIVDGAGQSASLLNYKTTDPTPYRGVSYYRLKQTDMDGSFVYSAVQAVNLQRMGDLSLSLYPNPTSGRAFNLGLEAQRDQEIKLVIYDAMGRVCHQQDFVASTDGYAAYAATLDRQLESGVYLVTVTIDKKTGSGRLVIQ